MNNQEQFNALRKFPDQIQYALDHYTAHGLKAEQYQQVLIGGLGGSGIGGRLCKAWFADKFPLPVEVISDYTLPAYVGEKTLVILSSYSGNTEETLELFDQAISKKCRVLVVTTGGKMAEKASSQGLSYYPAEKGYQPRMALGYSFTYLLLIFAELLGEDIRSSLQDTAERIRKNAGDYEADAYNMLQELKKVIHQKIIVATDVQLEGVGLRLAQQIQENAKHEAFQHTLPEANHNVIESYYGNIPSVFIFLRSAVHDRVSARFDFLTSLLEVEYHKVINLVLQEYELGSLLSLIYRLDTFSLLLADHRAVNATEIANIASLKEFLEGME